MSILGKIRTVLEDNSAALVVICVTMITASCLFVMINGSAEILLPDGTSIKIYRNNTSSFEKEIKDLQEQVTLQESEIENLKSEELQCKQLIATIKEHQAYDWRVNLHKLDGKSYDEQGKWLVEVTGSDAFHFWGLETGVEQEIGTRFMIAQYDPLDMIPDNNIKKPANASWSRKHALESGHATLTIIGSKIADLDIQQLYYYAKDLISTGLPPLDIFNGSNISNANVYPDRTSAVIHTPIVAENSEKSRAAMALDKKELKNMQEIKAWIDNYNQFMPTLYMKAIKDIKNATE